MDGEIQDVDSGRGLRGADLPDLPEEDLRVLGAKPLGAGDPARIGAFPLRAAA